MSRLYKTVKDYSKAVGMLPPSALFEVNRETEEISFIDVYSVLPRSLCLRVGERRKLVKGKGEEFFHKPLFDPLTYENFFCAMGYPLAHVSTPLPGQRNKILVLVSPYGKERVHANKVYISMREIEARYLPANFSTNEENNYINRIIKTYNEASRPRQEGERGRANRYILATEESIDFTEYIARDIAEFGHRFVSDVFVQYMVRVAEGIKEDLEKVKLPWSKKQLARSTNGQI